MKGVDYSFSRPDPAQIKKLGYDFVVRYIPYVGTDKGLTKDELGKLNSAGLSVAMVFESTAGRAKEGRKAGRDDAAISNAAMNILGMNGRPIYFAVDFDAAESDQTGIDEYLRGCADIIGAGRVGVYGGYWVVKRCAENGSARYLWQTYAWSGGNKLDNLHLYQYRNGQNMAGGSVDLNESYQADFGQFPAPQGGVSEMNSTQEATAIYEVLGHTNQHPGDDIIAQKAAFINEYGYAGLVKVLNDVRDSIPWLQPDQVNKSVENATYPLKNQIASLTASNENLEKELVQTEKDLNDLKTGNDQLDQQLNQCDIKLAASQRQNQKLADLVYVYKTNPIIRFVARLLNIEGVN